MKSPLASDPESRRWHIGAVYAPHASATPELG
jgi:hypothetical protein